MFFRSFAAYSHVFALILTSLLLLSLPDAARGASQNVTIRFDSTQVPVSFTTGWRVAGFTEAGTVDKFAFANDPGEQLIVQLPQNLGLTALFYRGFKIQGGARYRVCFDCDENLDTIPNSFTVDAHDEADNGTQPPVTLFEITEVDPTQTHVLRVINLEDDRFNGISQITFDSLILTLVDPADSSAPAGSPTSTTSASATSTVSAEGNPTTTVVVSPTDGSSSTSTATSSTSTAQSPSASPSQSATTGVATTSTGSSNPQEPTSISSGGGGGGASQTSTSTGSQSQTQTQTVGSISGSVGSQPTSTTGSSPSSTSTSGSTSGPDTSSSSNVGVSKTVIIVVAVIASLFVLALLAAITWLLVRNQPPPRGDVEGTTGLMRQAASAASVVVSGPLPLSPMRPEIPNPFVDPLDDRPPPRPAPPPPVPPRSQLRASNFASDRPAWLTRTPRTPSPEASNE